MLKENAIADPVIRAEAPRKTRNEILMVDKARQSTCVISVMDVVRQIQKIVLHPDVTVKFVGPRHDDVYHRE
jgi:hypothetical protein